jgi:tetratricopeptide (TPR) repeat protein
LGAGEQQLADAHAIAGYPLLYLGRYAAAQEQAQRSLELYGNDDKAIYSFNIPGWVALAEQSYAEASQWLTKVCQIGQTGIVQPVDVGQAKATLAYAERGLGQPEEAKRHLFELLKTTITTQAFMWFLPLIKALTGIALLLADGGHTERAVGLCPGKYPPDGSQ